MNKLETPVTDTIKQILETTKIGNKVLEIEFDHKIIQEELVLEAKYYIWADAEFEQEMHPNIEGTEEEFVAKAHAIIDAVADEATNYAITKRPLFYELSPRAIINYEGYRTSWNERLEDEMGNA